MIPKDDRRMMGVEFHNNIKYHSKDDTYYFNLGVEFHKNRKYKQAFNSFVKTTKKNPNHAEAHYYMGCSLTSLYKLSEALRAFDKAIEINPNKGYYYASKGIALYLSNQYESAVQNLYEALKLEPNKHWHVLAQVHIYNRNFDEASKCLDKALINYPNNDFLKKLRLLIISCVKFGKNYHIPIERSLLLSKIPPDDEIIYTTQLNVKITNKKLFTNAIITKKGISTQFPLLGIVFAGWENIKFTSSNKFRMSGYNCSPRWDSRYESSANFNERKKTFREDINKLRNT